MGSAYDSLKSFPLFEDFSEPDLAMFASILDEQSLARGEFVFHEGDGSNEIFFITDGEIEFLMKDSTGSDYRRLATSERGDMFGEMAFLDDSGRSAAARAVQDTKLLRLRKELLVNLPDNVRLEKELTVRIARTIAMRLKRENRNIIASFEKEREARQHQHEFGQFFIYVLVCYAIGMMINRLLYTRLSGVNVYADIFTWSYLGILLVPGLFLIWKWNIPLERVGVTLKGWKRSCTEGILGSLALALLFAGAVVFVKLTHVMPLKAPNYDILMKPEYALHSYAQEFLARGLLQGSLRRFFADDRGFLSVHVSSALFALLHIHFGFAAVILTFVSSVVLGLLYLRHENLLGVTIVHWAMGVCAFLSGLL